MNSNNKVGLTKDSGWQMGVRKTINREFDVVWDFMFSNPGLKIWLGNVDATELEVGKKLNLDNGTSGEIVVFNAFSHLRMKWKKNDWENISRLQLRIIRSKNKTVISFAQEMMSDRCQREEMILYWKKVVAEIAKVLE